MQEKVIYTAKFNPAVKLYWLLSLLLFSTLSIVGIPLLLVSIPLFFLITTKILAAMSATITERKLVVKRGIFYKEEKSIPLDKITDVGMTQGPLMRRFNLYRLTFETAGQSSTGALVSLIGIEDAANFREIILTQKDKLVAGGRPFESDLDNTFGEKQGDMVTLLASVKRIEALLEIIAADKPRKS